MLSAIPRNLEDPLSSLTKMAWATTLHQVLWSAATVELPEMLQVLGHYQADVAESLPSLIVAFEHFRIENRHVFSESMSEMLMYAAAMLTNVPPPPLHRVRITENMINTKRPNYSISTSMKSWQTQ